jgi:hypothetical protein
MPNAKEGYVPHRNAHGEVVALSVRLIDGKWISAHGLPVDIEREGFFHTEAAAVKEGMRRFKN